jgi:cyanophycin synthetase
MSQQGGLFVVKPASGSSSGMGVSTHVRTRSDLGKAVALACLYGRQVVIERMVFGETCRLLYLGGRFIHAVRRRGARVTGDGRQSVRELLEQKGSPPDDVTIVPTLRAQSLLLDSVPRSGKEVVVGTDIVADSLVEQTGAAVRALGTEFAGVDIITNDPTRDLKDTGGVFLEINTTPSIHHHYVTQGKETTRPVAVEVLEYLFTPKPLDRP